MVGFALNLAACGAHADETSTPTARAVMLRQVRRFSLASVITVLVLAVGACGGEDAPERGVGLEGPSPTTLTPAQQAAPDLPSVDGFLVSASETEVVLETPDGAEQRFPVKAEDVPRIGIEHLGSHAGVTDVGFRVYYQDEGGQRYVKLSTEIPPPAAR